MFCNFLIMKSRSRCLRTIYKTQTGTYMDLPNISSRIDIHTQIQLLMIECLNKLSPPFTWHYYNQKCNSWNLAGKTVI